MYIKTKDGRIIDTTKYPEHPASWSVQASDYALTIAQSDTIEELCDEGVIEVKFSSTGYIAHFNKNIDELRKFLKYLEECQPITKDEILNVYGAVWTEWGLKYVAKMNEDGKLVLI